MPVLVLLILKALLGGFNQPDAALMTIFEIFALAVSSLLVHFLNKSLSEFESVVAKISIGRRDRLPESASVGQGFIYREVRRARNHNRPLTLMTIGIDFHSKPVEVDRIVQEAQQAIIKQYQVSGVSKLLCDQLDDCAVIVQDDDRFIVALPETKPEEVPFIIDRLRRQVSEHLGVRLDIGASAFPKDGYTLEGLMETAAAKMKPGTELTVRGEIAQQKSGHI